MRFNQRLEASAGSDLPPAWLCAGIAHWNRMIPVPNNSQLQISTPITSKFNFQAVGKINWNITRRPGFYKFRSQLLLQILGILHMRDPRSHLGPSSTCTRAALVWRALVSVAPRHTTLYQETAQAQRANSYFISVGSARQQSNFQYYLRL